MDSQSPSFPGCLINVIVQLDLKIKTQRILAFYIWLIHSFLFFSCHLFVEEIGLTISFLVDIIGQGQI